MVQQKGLTTRNTRVKYESSITYHPKVMPIAKVFVKKRDLDYLILTSTDALTLVPQKGLTTRNTHVKYERSITHHSKVMANVKVLLVKNETLIIGL